MKDEVYKHIELTGTSTKSAEEAVNTALKLAGESIKRIDCFQIVETRESIEKNLVNHWQVKRWQVNHEATIKVGFAVEDTGRQGDSLADVQCV